MKIWPGLRCGNVVCPPSKSHLHRLLIASFLSGNTDLLEIEDADSDDIAATKRCLKELSKEGSKVLLDCGESGSTLRFLAPVAAALGKKAEFLKAGRLAERPCLKYETLRPGDHVIGGNVSSQFATGLLFVLPLLDGDSRIVFSSPLQSRGYVQMTLDILRSYGIKISEFDGGYEVPGNQRYKKIGPLQVEPDWSSAAFWLAMNSIGSNVELSPLESASYQPDKVAKELFHSLPSSIDVSEYPDLFPALVVAAAARSKVTTFTGIERLKVKECDRVAAMEDMLKSFGVEVQRCGLSFVVHGTDTPFKAAKINTYGDHRIAMAAAVAATVAQGPVEIEEPTCVKKSYPGFFEDFASLKLKNANDCTLAALSLGSNIEPRSEYLAKAVEKLSFLPNTQVVLESSIIATKGVGVPKEFEEMDFLNLALLVRTSLDAFEFSKRMHLIEDELGRVRGVRNSPRTIDIDLIAFGDMKIERADLTLPHPRAAERDFVKKPLAEIGYKI